MSKTTINAELLLFFVMYEYKIPSKSAFVQRKKFHSNQRAPNETAHEWFYRVFECLNGCKFGEYADFLMIDKFFSGLDNDTFDEYALKTTFTIDEALLIGIQHKQCCENRLETAPALQNADDIQEYLPIDHIKVEENDEINSICATDWHLSDRIYEAEMKRWNDRFDSKEELDAITPNKNVETVAKRSSMTQLELGISDEIQPTIDIKGFKRDKNKRITCLDCGKCFTAKNSYNYHKRIHTGQNLFYCKYCGKRCVKEVHLRAHMLTHQQDNKSFECYLCASRFDRMHGLRIHFTISHTTKVARNECPMCKKAFAKPPDLELHIKVHRGLIEGHKCQHCDKIFDRQNLLKEHLKVHIDTKEFVCETCGRAYKTQQLLRKHKRTHYDSRRFECCECGQVLKSTQTLKNHMRQHTGERPYNCDLCEKKFVTRPSLTKHLRVHRNEKPHGCTVCSKRFATSYHLKIHINTHTGAKPYECNECDRAFTQLGTLKAHKLKVHVTPTNQYSI